MVDQHYRAAKVYYAKYIPAITSEAFANVVRHAQNGSLYKSTLLAMTLGADVTREGLTTSRNDMGFFDRLAGPGPRATTQARLQALGLDLGNINNGTISLGPLIDFWTFTLDRQGLWAAMLHVIRYVSIVQPVIVRISSAKVSYLMVNDHFETVLAQRSTDNRELYDSFMSGSTHSTDLIKLVSKTYKEPRWEDCKSSRWLDLVGRLCVVRVGTRYVITLLSYDAGTVAYDPALKEVLITMIQLIAIKGVKLEEAAMKHVEKYGDPAGNEEKLIAIMNAANKACKVIDQELDAAKAEAEKLYKLVGERHARRWENQIQGEKEDGTYQEVSASCNAATDDRNTPADPSTHKTYWQTRHPQTL
jgi:hypothetical protein